MMKTRYHPLIDRDTEGNDKYPMFFTDDETTAASGHGWYLEEMRSLTGMSANCFPSSVTRT